MKEELKIKLEKELEKAKEEKHEDSGIIDAKDEPISLANSPTNNPLEILCTICSESIEEYVPRNRNESCLSKLPRFLHILEDEILPSRHHHLLPHGHTDVPTGDPDQGLIVCC